MNWAYYLFSFEGRIRRKTYWLALIAILAAELVIAAIGGALAETAAGERAGDLALDFVGLVFLYPKFAIDVKRGHDRNIPFWVIALCNAVLALYEGLEILGLTVRVPQQSVYTPRDVLSFVALFVAAAIGLALLVELGFRKGTTGPNRYGPDPLAKSEAVASQ